MFFVFLMVLFLVVFLFFMLFINSFKSLKTFLSPLNLTLFVSALISSINFIALLKSFLERNHFGNGVSFDSSSFLFLHLVLTFYLFHQTIQTVLVKFFLFSVTYPISVIIIFVSIVIPLVKFINIFHNSLLFELCFCFFWLKIFKFSKKVSKFFYPIVLGIYSHLFKFIIPFVKSVKFIVTVIIKISCSQQNF